MAEPPDDPIPEPARLIAPRGAPYPFAVAIEGAGMHDLARTLIVSGKGRTHRYGLDSTRHDAWLDAFSDLARDFGARTPLNRRPAGRPRFEAPLRPLLTEPLSPKIRYGYGDPAVIRTEQGYILLVTSNDAPDAFPILHSPDLEHWTLGGFVFPAGHAPAWALTGEGEADFWAPEMHRVGREYWVCFAARARDRSLAIGLAKADRPEGPFRAADAPLVEGGMIDPHIVIDRAGAPILIWKADANELWPRRLASLLHARAALIAALFPEEADRRTASLAATLQPWLKTLEPMEQFFVLQPLIESVTADFAGFQARASGLIGGEPALDSALHDVLEATRTHIWAQALSADGTALIGPRTAILRNDLPWEAHLIEGPWISEIEGRFWLFYAGNDFSTEHYGIGAAVAEHPLGPYRKMAEPLLRSTDEWRGPGHPSVTVGPDGEPRMLLHAFFPGRMGYKAFRALLSARLEVDGDGVRVRA